jgi:hypothetical protein
MKETSNQVKAKLQDQILPLSRMKSRTRGQAARLCEVSPQLKQAEPEEEPLNGFFSSDVAFSAFLTISGTN